MSDTAIPNMSECAALRCEENARTGTAYLERINKKGEPFVGLCENHFNKSVPLKPWAVDLLEGIEGS